jgi:hypothetical protein
MDRKELDKVVHQTTRNCDCGLCATASVSVVVRKTVIGTATVTATVWS